MKIKNTLLTTLVACSIAVSSANALIIVGGAITTTGGTVNITQDITLNITSSGFAQHLVLDNWVTNDGNFSGIELTPNTLSYQINDGSIQTAEITSFTDNSTITSGVLTPDDGYFFFDSISVTAGDTLKILSASYTTTSSPNWNPEAIQSFAGDVFLASLGGSTRLSDNVAVPEPSTYAALAGLAMLGYVIARRRK